MTDIEQLAKALRDVGFTADAMQFPRPPEAIDALKAFNGMPSSWSEPEGWRYFPNAWCRDNWRTMTPPRTHLTSNKEPGHGE